MFIRKAMLMTAAIIGVAAFSTNANAVDLNTNTGVSLNAPAVGVRTNTNANVGATHSATTNVKTHVRSNNGVDQDYQGSESARVNADGSTNSRVEESSTATDTEGNVSARHRSRVHTRVPTVNGQVDATTNVYEDHYAEGDQMTRDMNANDGIRAGAGVNTVTSMHLNN